MLTPETRFIDWNNFRERVHELCSDVEDALTFTYAPYGQPKDKDAAIVHALFKALEALDEALTTHTNELYSEWEELEALEETCNCA